MARPTLINLNPTEHSQYLLVISLDKFDEAVMLFITDLEKYVFP